jgi:hypothetical protein
VSFAVIVELTYMSFHLFIDVDFFWLPSKRWLIDAFVVNGVLWLQAVCTITIHLHLPSANIVIAG